ncbi:hypothetical protein OQ496_09380 [Acetobacter suratthaniensis]|uniref:Uncharacterized protein n=1 Tax=Acetobacter suratthaniensis TaxID=1502841 RepID=A0ABS3LMQ7_9PROT|nr:hypothetical protein [Acetobacter suratthaniensis]MBO1328659.1 hypothetical protein [Acetobacter suratthaniensis]MCX2566670.1 hypothetical protein [Acetobacter suratthaniensis]
MSKKAFISSKTDAAGHANIRIGNLGIAGIGRGGVMAEYRPATTKEKTVQIGVSEFSFLSRLALLCLRERSEEFSLDQELTTWLEGYLAGMSDVQIPSYQLRSLDTQNPPTPQSQEQAL